MEVMDALYKEHMQGWKDEGDSKVLYKEVQAEGRKEESEGERDLREAAEGK